MEDWDKEMNLDTDIRTERWTQNRLILRNNTKERERDERELRI